MSNPNRHEVLQIYKSLLYLLRDYPLGYSYARPRLYAAFKANAGLEDKEKIREGIRRAEFVRKGMSFSNFCYLRWGGEGF